MNRGSGRQKIFHGAKYYEAFLETLEESHNRFDAQIHAYCLMDNHYHLSIATPRANLGRIMRHINGVYTQRYNRLKRTDGPLFRGRYKAILIDDDAYLLQLGRYIHRNPAVAPLSVGCVDRPSVLGTLPPPTTVSSILMSLLCGPWTLRNCDSSLVPICINQNSPFGIDSHRCQQHFNFRSGDNNDVLAAWAVGWLPNT